jgi:hypothetical protein
MLVVFVHGWSVTNTRTYGGLPEALAKNASPGLNIQIRHIYLGKYVSFADEVQVDDIARGMEQAINEEVVPKLKKGDRFACITHSTGGPVVRKWIDLYYRGKLEKCPLGHLVMLAPANHGSALAQLGKGRIARMKFFVDGVEPGTGVLNWLELGSEQSWDLNREWLTYDCVGGGLYPFVLTGQKIDRNFYDNLNAYTGEPGSDGVVRVAAANMNYGLIRLAQKDGAFKLSKEDRIVSATNSTVASSPITSTMTRQAKGLTSLRRRESSDLKSRRVQPRDLPITPSQSTEAHSPRLGGTLNRIKR